MRRRLRPLQSTLLLVVLSCSWAQAAQAEPPSDGVLEALMNRDITVEREGHEPVDGKLIGLKPETIVIMPADGTPIEIARKDMGSTKLKPERPAGSPQPGEGTRPSAEGGQSQLLSAPGCASFNGDIVCCANDEAGKLQCETPPSWIEEHPMHAAIAAAAALLIALISVPVISRRGNGRLNRTTATVLSIAILSMASVLIAIVTDKDKVQLSAAAFSVLGTLAGFIASRSSSDGQDDSEQPSKGALAPKSHGQDGQIPPRNAPEALANVGHKSGLAEGEIKDAARRA